MAKNDYEELQEQLRQDALQAAAAGSGQQPPTYAGTYEDQLSQIYDRIQNREPFKYDVNADHLYQNYKDQYVQGGKLAMKDTMGQAAALTGGYGSTYGQQVGQQAYDAYLQNLSAVIPQLYGMAYDRYKDQGDDLIKQAGLLGQQRDAEYGRYRDAVGDYNYRQNVARQLEDTEYSRRMSEQNAAYSREQNAYSNIVALIKAAGYEPSDDELAAAGLSREAAEALRMEWLRVNRPEEYAALLAAQSGAGGGVPYWTPAPEGEKRTDKGISDDLAKRKAESGKGKSEGRNVVGELVNGVNLPIGGSRVVSDPVSAAQVLDDGSLLNVGSTPTRGEITREATRAYMAGELTLEEYMTIKQSVR